MSNKILCLGIICLLSLITTAYKDGPLTVGTYYYLDAPSRMLPSRTVIPVVVYLDSSLPVNRIEIRDVNNNRVIASRVYEPPLFLSDAVLPYTVSFDINKSDLTIDNEGFASIKAEITTLTIFYPDVGPVKIRINTTEQPKLQNYFCGDTHYQSSYTKNPLEFGGPISETKKVAESIGLDWVTVTDHSFDVNDTPTKWTEFVNECNQLDSNFKCLIGEEISCMWRYATYGHYLGYNISALIPGCEYEDDWFSGGKCYGKTLNCSEIDSKITSQKGFGYVAHPFNSDPFRSKWQNYNLAFTGLEIWNGEKALNNSEFLNGLFKWISLLGDHLSDGRRIYVEGGNDAHGDFNSDFGKVRTCCYMSEFSKDNVFDALKNGRCYMTNGPALAFSVENDLSYDRVDLGGTLIVDPHTPIAVRIKWNSTSEFGRITKIRVYKGEEGGREQIVEEVTVADYQGSETLHYDKTPRLTIDENSYIRLEAYTNEGKQAYTNPIWVNIRQLPNFEIIGHKIGNEMETQEGEAAADENFNTGEILDYTFIVNNTGKTPAENIEATITSNDPCVEEILDAGPIQVGRISPGEAVEIGPFEIETEARGNHGCEPGRSLQTTLVITVPALSGMGIAEAKTWNLTFTPKLEEPNDYNTISEYKTDGDRNSSEGKYLVKFKLSDNTNVLGGTAYFNCGSRELDDAEYGYTGSAELQKYGSTLYDWKAYFNITKYEKDCEGQKLYWRAKLVTGYPTTQIVWTSSEAYEGGRITDDDTIAPTFTSVAGSGSNNPGEAYTLSASVTDAGGVRDDEYLPRAYYRYNSTPVDADNYDGIADLKYDGSKYTAVVNLSELHEGETLYWRVYAEDGDNTPAGAWSNVITGPQLAMKPPSTPASVGVNTICSSAIPIGEVNLDWSDSLDGSGIKQYEVEEAKCGAVNGTTASNLSQTKLSNKSVATYSYRIRAQDNKGNWGAWTSQTNATVVQCNSLTFESTTVSSTKTMVTARLRSSGGFAVNGMLVNFNATNGIIIPTQGQSTTNQSRAQELTNQGYSCSEKYMMLGGGCVKIPCGPTACYPLPPNPVLVWHCVKECPGCQLNTTTDNAGLVSIIVSNITPTGSKVTAIDGIGTQNQTTITTSSCSGSFPPLSGLWFVGLPTLCGGEVVSVSGELKLNNTLSLNGSTIKFT